MVVETHLDPSIEIYQNIPIRYRVNIRARGVIPHQITLVSPLSHMAEMDHITRRLSCLVYFKYTGWIPNLSIPNLGVKSLFVFIWWLVTKIWCIFTFCPVHVAAILNMKMRFNCRNTFLKTFLVRLWTHMNSFFDKNCLFKIVSTFSFSGLKQGKISNRVNTPLIAT